MISILILVTIAWWSYFLFARVQAASHPAFIFSIFWLIVLSMAKIFSGSQLNIDAAAIYILSAVLAFSCPAILFKKIEVTNGNHTAEKSFLMIAMLIIMQIAIIVGIILHIQAQGLSIFTALKSLDKFGGDFIGLRYSGKITSTLYIQIATSLNFVCAALCGLIVANDRRYLMPAFLTIAAFLPSVTIMFFLGDKGTLPQAIALYCGGLFVGWICAGKTTIMTKRAAAFFSIGVFVLVPIMITAMIIKIVGKFQIPHLQLVENLCYSFRSYALGSVYAFSDWLKWYVGYQENTLYIKQNNTLGLLTFWGLAKYLPTAYQMPVGYYSEYFEVQGVVRTNIYTVFRGLIIDFGLLGSLIFLGSVGYASAAAYQSMVSKYFAPLSQTFYIMLIGAIYASILISFGTWTSPFVAAILLYVILSRRSLIPFLKRIHIYKKESVI